MGMLEGLLAAAPDAMLAVAADGRIVMVNRQVDELFGFDPGELEGQLVEVLIPAPLRASHPVLRERFAADPSTRPMGAGVELEGRRRDGSTFPAEISLAPIDADGEQLVIAAIRDVSKHRTAEAKFRALLEAAPDAMVGVDASGRIVLVNGQTERLFGYERAELLGELVELLVPDGARSVHPDHRARYFGHPATRPMGAELELDGRRKDGTTFPAEISLSALETEDGLLVTAAIRDVTERKEVEAEAHAARIEAERANRAKSEFLSRMSHELRTPLNAILGFAQLLEVNDPTLQQAQHIEYILKAGHHLLDLIDEVLDISRIEAGRLEMALEPVPLGPLLAESADLLRPLAEAQNVLVRIDPDADRSVHVLADGQRLRQVVLNLVANAVKYNKPGGSVDISWSVHDGVVRVGVVDTGIGIAEEVKDRLFLPFERLATDSGVEGTGLGLALSRGLVQGMGGHIGAESRHQLGSTFWFELHEALDRDGSPMVGTVPPLSRRPHRVLYVEDNLSNLRLVEEILGRRGDVEVVPTIQGALALDLARRHHPDLVLLDLHLPDMDGEEVLDRLQGDPATRDIPVIVVSADATAARMERMRARGVLGYLTKPIDVVQFQETVSTALSRMRTSSTR